MTNNTVRIPVSDFRSDDNYNPDLSDPEVQKELVRDTLHLTHYPSFIVARSLGLNPEGQKWGTMSDLASAEEWDSAFEYLDEYDAVTIDQDARKVVVDVDAIKRWAESHDAGFRALLEKYRPVA